MPCTSFRARASVLGWPRPSWAHFPAAGLLGQGRTLVRRNGPKNGGWRLALPAELTLTSHQPGAVHSALVRCHRVVLVGAGATGDRVQSPDSTRSGGA